MRSTSDVQLQPGQNRDHGMLNQMRSIVNPAIDNRSMILHRSRESCIVALDSGWRCLRLKCGEIHCPIKDDETWSTFNDTSQWPEQLTTTRIWRVAAGSPRVASEKRHGTESENTCNFPIFDTFGRYIWKAIAPRSKHSGTPKLELEVRRVRTVDGSPHPLPVVYTYAQALPIIPVVRIYLL